MWLILKTIGTIFLYIILSSQTVNGQREESYESQNKKEMESVRTKANGWKGEKVILLPSVISQALWCSEDLKNDELYHQIYIQGTNPKITDPLPAAKYAGKTGIIIDTNVGEYVSEYKQPEIIILLDDIKEKIVAPVGHVGFFKELDLARMLIGRTLQIKCDVSLGIAAEYCQDPKLRPRFKIHEMESVTVTRVEWGTDLQHIHLFVKIGSGEELVFDGYDGYDYFDEKFNMPGNLSGNYSRRFHVDMTFAEEYKTEMLRKTGQTLGQNGFKIELISTKLVNRVDAAFGGDWHSTDTSETKGLVIKVKMSKTPTMESLKTLYLIFELEDKGVRIKAPCLGMTLMSEENKDGFWILNDELDKGKYYEMTPPEEEKVEYVDFLFPIPLKVKSGILRYEDKVLIEKVKIK